MAARSSLLRRTTPGARPARRASSVVAALPALAPRLVRLVRHGSPDALLARRGAAADLDAELGDLLAERVAVDAEHLGRLHLVAARALEHDLDERPLDRADERGVELTHRRPGVALEELG